MPSPVCITDSTIGPFRRETVGKLFIQVRSRFANRLRGASCKLGGTLTLGPESWSRPGFGQSGEISIRWVSSIWLPSPILTCY